MKFPNSIAINFYFVFKMLGILCLLEIPFFLISMLVGLYYGNSMNEAFGCTILVASIVGGTMVLLGRKKSRKSIGRKEGMLLVALAWLVLSLIGMMPYLFSGYISNPIDAFFETMSGFTTTGATILDDIESLPKGLLLWRSTTQWQGGIGIIVLAIALLPVFGGHESMVYNYESSGVLHEKFLPRSVVMAKRVAILYVCITILCMLFFWLGPMDLFDAVCHAFTCVCSGGFSTKNSSIAYFDSAYIDWVAIVFMFLAGVNFSLIYFSIKGKFRKLTHDAEFRWYLGIVLVIGTITTIWIYFRGVTDNFITAIRYAFLQVISLISTTGYVTQDYDTWGSFYGNIAMLLMFISACTGSTSGGLKTGRFAILTKNLTNELKKRTHPSAVLPVKLLNSVIPSKFVDQVVNFFFAYFSIILIASLLLSLQGITPISAFSATIACISNSGPGLEQVGPIENFNALNHFSKSVLCFVMMIGRLEIFTVLTLFLPNFWKD